MLEVRIVYVKKPWHAGQKNMQFKMIDKFMEKLGTKKMAIEEQNFSVLLKQQNVILNDECNIAEFKIIYST